MAFKFNVTAALDEALGRKPGAAPAATAGGPAAATKPKFDVSSALQQALGRDDVSQRQAAEKEKKRQEDERKRIQQESINKAVGDSTTSLKTNFGRSLGEFFSGKMASNNPVNTYINKKSAAVQQKVTNYLNPAPDEVRQGVWANFGPELIRKTPILGSVIQSIDAMGAEDMDQFDQLKKKDWAKFTAQAAGATIASPFIKIGLQTKASFTGKPEKLKIGPLGDAGNFESYSSTVDRDIQEGMHPALAVLKQTPSVILDTLFVYGVAKSALSPREVALNKSGSPTKSTILGETPQPKSFRLYEKPKPQYIPIDGKSSAGAPVIDALSNSSRFKEGKPTFLKVETTGTGSLKARFVQIVPARVRGLFGPSEVGGRPVRVVPETVIDTKIITAPKALEMVPKTAGGVGLPTLPASPVPAPSIPTGQFPVSQTAAPNAPTAPAPAPAFPVTRAEAPKAPTVPTTGQFPASTADIPAAPISSPGSTTIRHYTLPENVNSILKEGFDTSKPPVHGTGGLEAGAKTGKFGQDTLYFTADDARWNKAQVYVGEGKGDISRQVYDYASQKWITEKDAYKAVDLKAVEANINTNAKVLKVDNLAAALDVIKANGRFDKYSFMEDLLAAARKEGYDVVNLMDKGNWTSAELGLTKYGKPDWYQTLTGNSGKNDYFVLNKKAITVKQPVVKAKPKVTYKDIQPTKKEMKAINDEANKFYEDGMEINYKKFVERYSKFSKRPPEDDIQYKRMVPGSNNIFYSQELTDSEVFDLFKRRYEGKSTRLGGNALASKNSRKLGTAERMPDNKPELAPAKPDTPQFKVFEKVEGLIRKYAKIIGEGYLPRNARGVYYRDTQNIFIDGMNNVSTAAHEITHFLDLKYGIIKDLISGTTRGALVRKKLTDLYVQYYSGGSRKHKLELRMREGYATLLQQYATTPKTIEAQYPTLVKEFLKPGGMFYKPVVGEVITDLHDMIDEYQALSALDKVGATIVTEDFKTDKPSFLNFWEKLRTVMVDDIYGLEVLDVKAGTANTPKSISLLTRGVRNHTSSVFQSNLSGKNGLWTMNEKGDMVKVSDNNIGNLMQQLSDKKIVNEFAFYLVARDGHFQWQELDKLEKQYKAGASTEEATAELKKRYTDAKAALEKEVSTREELTKAYEENKDRFAEEEKMFDELTRKGELDILHDALLMDDVKYKELTDKEGYASKKRVFYNELLGDSGTPSGSLGAGKTRVSAMIKRKGSSRAIQNPLYSLIKDHHEIMNKAGRQHIYNRILEIAPKFDKLFQIQTLKTDPSGASSMDRDPHYIMARKKVTTPEGSKVKRVPILTDNLVKQMIDNILTYEDIHLIEKVFRTASTVKTIGTTASYPAFGAVNVIRDQLTAPVFSVNKYKPLYTAIAELTKTLNPNSIEHQYAKEFFVLGGDHYTLVSFDQQTPEQVLKSVARESRGIKKYTVDLATGGLKIVQAPAKYSEVVTRMAEYTRARSAGKDQWTAMEDAQRVSGPFAHIGALQPLGKGKMTVGQTFVKSIPFANAGLQILDQTIRTLETPAGKQRFAFMAGALALAFGGAFLYMKEKATEEQKRELRNTDPTYLTQYIFIPKPSGKGFYRLPIPQNMATFGGMINMVLLNKWLGANYSGMEYVDGATTALPAQLNPTNLMQFVFSYFPQVLSATVQTAFWMRTFPKPQPVESERMKRLPDQFRYNDKTTPVAKYLGGKLGLSPIKIDFATTTWLGRATGLLTADKKALNPLSGFQQGYFWESGRTMDNYWKIKTEMEQDKTAFKKGFTKEFDGANRGLIKTIDAKMEIYNRLILLGEDDKAAELQKSIEELAGQLKKK